MKTDICKPIVNKPEWKYFEEYLAEELQRIYSILATTEDEKLIFRLQGQTQYIKGLLKMKENMNGRKDHQT